jgi:inosine/guanosine/xanthosine phosphorylase family protein
MPQHPQTPDANATAAIVSGRTQIRPKIAVVLGSGFGGVASAITVDREFPYRDLPGFPVGSVTGHAGRMLVGRWHGVELVILSGRAHYYEGFELSEATFPTRVLAALGVKTLLLTNAAGGIRRDFKVGDFMAITDHINLMGANPLRGPEAPGRNRFVDMTQVYDRELAGILGKAAQQSGVRLHQGVYIAVSGPSFETPAEIRAFAVLGADAVGMSTVPEAIVARQCGLRVAGVSCITNAAAGMGEPGETINHLDVLALAKEREAIATEFVGSFVRQVGRAA